MSMAQAKSDLIAANAYPDDVKTTLLGLDLTADSERTGLAGFTSEVRPLGADPHYVDSNVRLAPSLRGGRF